MAVKGTVKTVAGRANAGAAPAPPPRLRLRLSTIDDVKREMGKLYRETRAGKVDTQDASRMSNMLSIMGRLIDGSNLEKRFEEIEQALEQQQGKGRRK